MPESLGLLTGLTEINLSANCLDSLPNSLRHLSATMPLRLDSRKLDLQVMKLGLHNAMEESSQSSAWSHHYSSEGEETS